MQPHVLVAAQPIARFHFGLLDTQPAIQVSAERLAFVNKRQPFIQIVPQCQHPIGDLLAGLAIQVLAAAVTQADTPMPASIGTLHNSAFVIASPAHSCLLYKRIDSSPSVRISHKPSCAVQYIEERTAVSHRPVGYTPAYAASSSGVKRSM